jgi:AcrR family transcriptional regulator
VFGTLFVKRTWLYNAFVPASSQPPEHSLVDSAIGRAPDADPDSAVGRAPDADPDSAVGRAAELAPVPAEPGVIPSPPRLHRRRRPTRRTALTLDAIVAAAIDTLDEAGVAGLTMRRVAERLGTGAASLYAHVSGRDELLELVFDELVGQVPLPVPDPDRWREQLRRMLLDLYRTLNEHADAALAGMGRVATSPRALDATERIALLTSLGGLTERVAAFGIDQLVLFVCATAFEDGILERSGMSPDDEARYWADLHMFLNNLPPDRFPAMARIRPYMIGHGDLERFEFGLDAMLAGLEALSDAERSESR